MKIVLLGKNGQVGWELQRSLSVLGEVLAFDRHSAVCADLSDPIRLYHDVMALKPQVIVNAAAYTAVDRAEQEPQLAHQVNAAAPLALARAAKALNAVLVQYSSDYVFDGGGEKPWMEQDATGPLNVYGRSKLEGEQAIQAASCQHLILRTSWVYGVKGQNFAKTMLRLAKEKEQLAVIDDQYGAPTSADLLADLTAHTLRRIVVNPNLSGLYHLAPTGETTWHGYAAYVIAEAKRRRPDLAWQVQEVKAVPTSAFPTPAKRPRNSRLNTDKFCRSFELVLPNWELGVTRLLDVIL